MFEPIGDTPSVFAECPVWLPDPQRLCWVDCAAGRLYSLDWRRGVVNTVLALPGTLFSALVRYDDATLLLFTGRGALVVDADGRTRPFPLPRAVDAGLVNDGKVDTAGRIWIGQVQSGDGLANGSLQRLAGPSATTMVASLGIPNGPAFASSGDRAYCADSLKGTVDRLLLGPGGAVVGRRCVLRCPEGRGQPDGMTLDAKGSLFVALHGGGAVLRIGAGSDVPEVLAIPAARPTSCAFGGPDLATLFVTVANGPWPNDRRHPGPPPPAEPARASLYAVTMQTPGFAEPVVRKKPAGHTRNGE